MADRSPLGLEAARLLAAREGDSPILHVTASEGRAEALARLLRDLAPGLRTEAFPPWDCLPFDWASPSPTAMGRRMSVLRKLADPGLAPRLLVASPAALLQRLPPRRAVRAFPVRVGGPLDLDALRAFCTGAGYREDDRVDEPGEVAVRGNVVDLFDPDSDCPYRIEFDGAVHAIRRYDPATQRSLDEWPELVVDAATELPPDAEEPEPGAEHRLAAAWGEPLATLLDHMGPVRITLGDGAARAARQALAGIREAHGERSRHDTPAHRTPPPEALHLTADEWDALAADAETLDLTGAEPVPAFAEDPRPRAALRAWAEAQEKAGRRILLAATQAPAARRLREALGRPLDDAPDWDTARAAPPGAALRLPAALGRGFVDASAGLAVLAARDLLGHRATAAPGDAPALPWTLEAAELHEGDIAVHLDHGVARLAGLEAVEAEGLEGEAIALEFAEGERLLVPSAEAGRVWRYGPDTGEVALDRLHGTGWPKRRAQVLKGLRETARGLVAAAEARATRATPRLIPDAAPYERLVARFPYEETPDQARAVAAVLADLASGRPMDRLVIGDVGFGKTEVAIRAAGAVAFAGRQVAVLAPTTVLARQHFRSFQRRFEGLGVSVVHLSRLVTGAEARRTREAIANGSARIVVGTQALLAKGVAFHDLALAVVDEEQRLGRADKERLRALVGDGHRLVLSATPIPRTLQTALVGLQDLSVIATPPARRRPIRTIVARRDPEAIRAALGRERRRGGQSFVVVPRVEDIEPVADELRALLPSLTLRVAHGQLPPKEIDEVMVGFAEGAGDVLLATSIIESGLDVPRANTMVVLRPDLFGLAQLHQLRGRVGRGGAQAHCHLLTDPGTELPPATLRRLGTLQALDRLGAGMAVAAQDLDLRGGGDLLGDRQSGHVRLIGLALYQELLAGALRAARGEPAEAPEVELLVAAPGTLPPDHIPEPELRLNLYHRLARTRDAADVDRLTEEMADRFGPPPPAALALLQAATIRALARDLGVSRVAAGPEALALDWRDPPAAEARHAETVAAEGFEWAAGRLVWRRPSEEGERLALALEMLEALA